MRFTCPAQKANAEWLGTAVSTWGTPPQLWAPARTCNTQQRWSDSITLSSPSLAWFGLFVGVSNCLFTRLEHDLSLLSILLFSRILTQDQALCSFAIHHTSIMDAQAQRKTKIFSRREIEGQIANGRAIVIVDNKVLNVGAWMPYHPGGDKAMRHMIGRDATDEVNA